MNLYIGGSRHHGVWTMVIGRTYLSLASPRHRPLFTERNRIRVRVVPLFRGWRIRVRRDSI